MTVTGARHHWFQFRLVTLCVVITIAAFAGRFWQHYHDGTEIEGSWRAIDNHKGLAVTFHHDRLAIVNQAGVRTSRFEVDKADGRITIQRDEGVQEGYYRIWGNQLELNLGTVGFPPPTNLQDKKRDAIHYFFERAK